MIPYTTDKRVVPFEIDDEDYPIISQFTWYLQERYIRTTKRIGGKQYTTKLHQLLMGHSLKSFDCDHIDGDRFNNKRSNLRICTHQQNSAKQKNSRNISRYRGVFANKGCNNWRAFIRVNKKGIHLGYFPTKEEAAS